MNSICATQHSRRKTIIFSNRAVIKRPRGGTKLNFNDGHEVMLVVQRRSFHKLRKQ